MKIAIAQIDPVIGAFEANVKKIKEAYKRACSKQARLLLTPELAVCGYPPLDLIERPEIFERNEAAVEELLAVTRDQQCALVVGHVSKNPSDEGKPAQNVLTVLENGKRVFRQAKTLLPTYDVFDEARYFEPAKKNTLWECDGRRIAFAICEDLWGNDTAFGRKLYSRDPLEIYRKEHAELVISLSASPYVMEKSLRRETLHKDAARMLNAPLVYVNQVGATDEILFDGGSFALNADGALSGRLPFFKNSFGVIDIDFESGACVWESPEASAREDERPLELEIFGRALVTGIREYFLRTGFKTAILGLSGGIDSAVVAVLAAKALGPQNVLGLAMPSQVSSGHSLEDAEALAKNLGIRFEVRPIKFLFSAMSREIAEPRGGVLAPIALENLQTRLRGVILMTLANHYSALTLTTGNKSEIAMGYCTLYGDMAGALAPIGDLLKTRVYELAHHLNGVYGNPIPNRSITKAPSAELRPNQTDQDTLPPYEFLDEVLLDYIEKGMAVSEIESKMGQKAKSQKQGWVSEVLRTVERNEYKRRQAAPVLKVSSKAFGVGRRVPISKHWET
ncbi:NAD+ synthase [Bdellovibrionota bacterium FG-2]